MSVRDGQQPGEDLFGVRETIDGVTYVNLNCLGCGVAMLVYEDARPIAGSLWPLCWTCHSEGHSAPVSAPESGRAHESREATHEWIRKFVGDHAYAHVLADDAFDLLAERAAIEQARDDAWAAARRSAQDAVDYEGERDRAVQALSEAREALESFAEVGAVQFDSAEDLAEWIRTRARDTLTAMGGAHQDETKQMRQALAAIRDLPSERDLFHNAVARAMWEYARQAIAAAKEAKAHQPGGEQTSDE